MEEKKDYRQQSGQKFYFTDEGQLVVESNKGVWSTVSNTSRCTATSLCNAKTMGIIIHQLKRKDYYDIRRACDIIEENTYCVLGVGDERLSEIIEQKAERKAEEYNNNYTWSLEKQAGEDGDRIHELKMSIKDFNALPWYKRIFKKIKIQTN